MSLPIITRAQWGATPWEGTIHRVPLAEKDDYLGHYHGGVPRHSVGIEVPREVEQIHLANGWLGVGYNFLVDMAGTIYEGRGWDGVGSQCPGFNRSGVGVYLAFGGLQIPTQASLRSFKAIRDELERKRGSDVHEMGHRDGVATKCPGDWFYKWIHAGMPLASTGGSTAPISTRPPRVLVPYPGHQHSDSTRDDHHVYQIQTRLKQLGFYKGAIDASFGPKTEAAVRAFQKAKRITVDGFVGPQTWVALKIYNRA